LPIVALDPLGDQFGPLDISIVAGNCTVRGDQLVERLLRRRRLSGRTPSTQIPQDGNDDESLRNSHSEILHK
jgi:hypothetical protein